MLREAAYIACFIQQTTLLAVEGFNLSSDGTSGLYYVLEGLIERIENSTRLITDHAASVKGARHG
ncbi:hypothetical protein [Candidatus Nitrotoga arctica]|uniref:Uncharacterized protein n=1 Tax=Candidatus Nitrotoga arctica TaxID=453162 RepID=A0ABM8Z2P8_9PROT|nr:hypothetical protein [Candidatus Nitrotoga arctica]CAG9934085.1 protein of unknown function [Candidatus Nitrotoga arctica]